MNTHRLSESVRAMAGAFFIRTAQQECEMSTTIAAAEYVTSPFANGKPISKVDRYKWRLHNGPGELRWIDKQLLNIDHTYQRDVISITRVAAIRADWNWIACGTLIVAEREDGTFWVVDGQTRKRAAEPRADVPKLPCLVFQSTEKAFEAKAFKDVNENRGAVKSTQKYKAALVAREPAALSLQAALDEVGLRVGSGDGPNTVCCVVALLNLFADGAAKEELWPIIVEMSIFKEQHIIDKVVIGMRYVRSILLKTGEHSLSEPHNRERLIEAGMDAVAEEINSTAKYFKKGGERIYGQGVVKAVNKNRRTRKLPAMIEG